MCVCMCVCMYVCVCVCLFVSIIVLKSVLVLVSALDFTCVYIFPLYLYLETVRIIVRRDLPETSGS